MLVESRTPHHAAAYRPATEAERDAELAARNTDRLVDYYARSVEHLLQRKRATEARRAELRGAYAGRRA